MTDPNVPGPNHEPILQYFSYEQSAPHWRSHETRWARARCMARASSARPCRVRRLRAGGVLLLDVGRAAEVLPGLHLCRAVQGWRVTDSFVSKYWYRHARALPWEPRWRKRAARDLRTVVGWLIVVLLTIGVCGGLFAHCARVPGGT